MATKVTSSPKAKASKTASSKTTSNKTAAIEKKVAPKKAAVASKAAQPSKTAQKTVEGPGAVPKPLDTLGVPEVFPIEAIGASSMTSPAGIVYRLDGGFLDGLRAQVRRYVAADGKTQGTAIELKISGPSRETFEEALRKKGAKETTLLFHKASVKQTKGAVVLEREDDTQSVNSSFSTHAPSGHNESPLQMKGQGWTLDFVPAKGPIGLAGYLRIQLEGKPEAQTKALQQVIAKVGLQPAFAPPNGNAIRRYAMMRRLWAADPEAARKLASEGPLSDLKLEKVEKALAKVGVTKAHIDELRYEEVAPGHFTVMDPALLPELKKAGLAYAYSTVTSPDHVLSILQNGQKATLTRWAEGAMITGMSSMADIGSGGAQGVFSRLVTKSSDNKSWAGRTYKIILKPELLTRLDVWGWEGDYFGQSWDLTSANVGVGVVKAAEKVEKASSYGSGTVNEIISPVGNGPRFIAHVVATTEADRNKLITHLKSAKWKPADGRTVEAFVVLAPKMDIGLLDGKKPTKATKKAG